MSEFKLKIDWKCTKCNRSSYCHVDELKPNGKFGKSEKIRCLNCKTVFASPENSTVISG